MPIRVLFQGGVLDISLTYARLLIAYVVVERIPETMVFVTRGIRIVAVSVPAYEPGPTRYTARAPDAPRAPVPVNCSHSNNIRYYHVGIV